MYSPERTKQLQASTTQFLKTQKTLSTGDVELLRDVLRFHEYRYYILDEPLVSDFEYDQLFKALEKLEADHPELVSPTSPTQRVAKGLTKDFPTVSHLVPMLSLQNSYDAEDLNDWDRKCREASGLPAVQYCVEPKYDGASISVIYENDVLVRAATRGNGVQGDEITTNIRQIRSVPLTARFSDYGIAQIEIRGEVLMNKNNFTKYNEQLAAQHLAPFANPRNAASGSLRIKDPQEVKRRNLEAFFYHVSYYTTTGGLRMSVDGNTRPENFAPAQVHPALTTHGGTLQMLWDLGFRSPMRERQVFDGIEGVIAFCPVAEAGRDNMLYEVDGMVIKVNDIQLQEKLGMTSHHPRWAVAYKFQARQATSKLLKVEFNVGRTGAVTPVAKIEPVSVSGVTVSSISLFNEDVVKEKGILIGDTVLVERAGDVIPYIVKPLTELRTGSEQEIPFPRQCPACNDELTKPENEAVWRCVNVNCRAQVLERMIHFVSKDAMDIRSLGEANIRKFFELGFLVNIPSIYTLPYDKIGELEGFGPKSVGNLKAAIEQSKTQPLYRLIFALGIRYVGETTAKTLAGAVSHLLEFRNYSLEQLQQLEDVGVKVANSIYLFFSNDDNLHVLQELEQLGLNFSNTVTHSTTGDLQNLTFMFTGSLPTLKRSDAETMVEEKGGSVLGSVSSKLNFLVVGEDAGSKLEKAKKIQSIRIINEEEFIRMMKE
ncbi:MAG: NAD-dependent DNA ligase LigA [Williamsia sp.]|nr:NAD-dependent DNA ligase LigA [Williamsia sp.]